MISKGHIVNCIALVARKKNNLVSGRENIFYFPNFNL